MVRNGLVGGGRAWWWWAGLVGLGRYLPTLNSADEENFLTLPYVIVSLEQAWQNPSNINPRVTLEFLMCPTL